MSLKLDKTTMSLFAVRLSKCGPKLMELPRILNFKIEENRQSDMIANATLALVHYFKNGIINRGYSYQWIVFNANELIEKFCARLSEQIQAILNDWEIKQTIRATIEQIRKEQALAQRPKPNEYDSLANLWTQREAAKSKYDRMPTNATTLQKNEGSMFGKLNDNKLAEVCLNLLDKPQCLCQFPRDIKGKEEILFLCVHCNRRYHTVCMRKKTTSQFCCYCHLEKMVPLKRPVKTVFIGILRKTKKKHQAYFQIPEIQPNQKLQIRCLRLKEDAQQACLFPDIAQLSMNGQRIINYEPINRQSCLKYRKDEPYNLLKGDYYKGQENSFLLSEAVTLTRQRDVRNDPQNHLLGLFVVQDIKIDQFIQAAKAENILGFNQSQAALQGTFGLGKDDEITCQIVKIPLLCPLTTVKIEIPARGYYCTHYQCFDMKNYLTLISQSQNPRWTCPLCKSMSFELKIDSILMEVIKETKGNEQIKEILFFKNGDYSAIIDEEPLQQKKNIRSLNIPEKIRTRPPQLEKEQQKQTQRARPRKRVPFVIPQNAEFISLDD